MARRTGGRAIGARRRGRGARGRATSSSPSCTDRTGRTARSPRSATSPASRTSAPARGPAPWRWTSGRPSSSPSAVGVATAPGLLLTPATREMARWAGPCVVKPVAAGSSPGVSLVTEPHELGPALDAAFALDDRVLVEEVVHGREVDVAVLARPAGSRIGRPPWRSSPTGSSTTTKVRRRAPTSASPRGCRDRRADRRSRPPRSRVRRARLRRGRPGRLLPHRRRAGPGRGQHDAGPHRAVPGAADARRHRARATPTCSTCSSPTRCAPAPRRLAARSWLHRHP